MAKTWNLMKFKWLYWTGVIGFFASIPISIGSTVVATARGTSSSVGVMPLFWLIGLALAFFDRKKQATKSYQIEKKSVKYMIVVGNIYLVIIAVLFIGMTFIY